ncbi:MAG: arginine--tRNA ligase [Candidatus Dasytiphilus stammeri]
MDIKALIYNRIKKAMFAIGIQNEYKIQILKTKSNHFGDYQVNGIFTLAKKLNLLPYKLANNIFNNIQYSDFAYKVEIANSAYINFFLDKKWIGQQLNNILAIPNLGIRKIEHPQTIVIDYSAPNVAKEMHVGHLRSTIIGDATVRILTFIGHNVIRANHIGDWGMQFGILLAILKKKNIKCDNSLNLSKLEELYREAKQYYAIDENFAAQARVSLVKLQSGDSSFRTLWQKLIDITMQQNQKIYKRLKVTLTIHDVMGESKYNHMLPLIVTDLKSKGIAIESEGALVVFLDEFINKKGKPMGVIIKKKDGGYLYTTTDIACIKYRYETLHANRIIYYVDSRQQQHLKQVWTIVRKAGYIPESVSLEHHMFGMMLDKNLKPFKTSTGENIKLSTLIDEAIKRALILVSKKNPSLSLEKRYKIAKIIGIGAIKYSDLSKNRLTDYVFDWDQILSFDGNTFPYIQYAYIRALSILRKNSKILFTKKSFLLLKTNLERELSIYLLQFEEIIKEVASNGTPHLICNYLYSLAKLFSKFYEKYPILSSSEEEIKQSRLKIVYLISQTLNKGLELLGIETVDQL